MAKIGYAPIGKSILSPVEVLFPIEASIMSADRVLYSTEECPILDRNGYAPIGNSIMTAVRVLFPIEESIMTAVRVLFHK